jgi:pimeloyl-ACP methyl ester carboxylesterase
VSEEEEHMVGSKVTGRFQADDGVEIVHDQWPDADPGGIPVVLHHGFVTDARLNWVATGIVEALCAAGRRVVAVDARGHGRSGTPHEPEAYGEARMAADVAHLVDELGVPTFDLVGYSMGAVVSLLVAGRDERLRRLAVGGVGEGILVCGGVDRRAVHNDELATALRADDPTSLTGTPAAFRQFADAIGADRLALAAQASVAHGEPIPLQRITVPTLVLAGRDDELAVEPQRLAEAIPGAVLHLVDGDHLGALTDPAFVPALLAFLAAAAD